MMIPYVECPVCKVIPEEDRGFYSGPESVAKYPDVMAICNIPTERGLEKATGGTDIWVCRNCGTYYYADSLERGYPSGSIQTRLFRMTVSQAWNYLTKWYRRPTAESEALSRSYAQDLRTAEKWLIHVNPAMRIFGARTLADEYKMQSNWKSLKALLTHGNGPVRQGAVSAFRRGVEFMIDIEPKPIIVELANCLSDPDKDVRYEASRVLVYAMDGRFWGKGAKTRLRKRALAERTREEWEILLAQPESMEDLRQGLLSQDGEIRSNALTRAYDWSEFHRAEVPRFKEFLSEIPEHDRPSAMEEYLRDPDPAGYWSRDDD
jgi:hypothetical protein